MRTFATVVQPEVCVALGKATVSLHKYAIPFSLQLCMRYLRGIDLDFDAKLLKAVTGFAEDRGFGPPSFLLIANVSSLRHADDQRRISVNRNTFEALE
jgi:hypothetical protein